MGIKHCERKGQDKENTGQPRGDPGQNVRRLRAENVFGDRPAKGSSKPLALGPLHQNDEHQKNANDDKKAEEQVD